MASTTVSLLENSWSKRWWCWREFTGDFYFSTYSARNVKAEATGPTSNHNYTLFRGTITTIMIMLASIILILSELVMLRLQWSVQSNAHVMLAVFRRAIGDRVIPPSKPANSATWNSALIGGMITTKNNSYGLWNGGSNRREQWWMPITHIRLSMLLARRWSVSERSSPEQLLRITKLQGVAPEREPFQAIRHWVQRNLGGFSCMSDRIHRLVLPGPACVTLRKSTQVNPARRRWRPRLLLGRKLTVKMDLVLETAIFRFLTNESMMK